MNRGRQAGGRTPGIGTPASRAGGRALRAIGAAVLASLGLALAACGNVATTLPISLEIFPPPGKQASARLLPRNGSAISGRFTFVQRGEKVAVIATVFDLTPGPHSIHIHEIGNCSSLNAASAGPVWDLAGTDRHGRKRIGDLPELVASPEGLASLSVELRGLSVASGAKDDIVGHSVVVQDGYAPDPKAQFGVPNDWIGCGVIERG